MSDLREFDVRSGVDEDAWQLSVTGTVEQSVALSIDELRALPLETYTEDFACVEGWVAEDCSWRGVRVASVLELAEPTDASTYALVHGMDDEYACSFPLARLADAVLAVELDGERLPVEHGGPARLVPTASESDCWESIKWVRRIDLRETEPIADDTAEELALSRIE
ncbi:molybdopterin-dependent oxidoreductase [Natrinema ejinorense]|uniref:Molybdopterin-binding oxidoreductase n=1 Tax=Natrinema ejinorense TaxID=373386 RepID=A0A2A5QVT3_9EURY|nr:molybdopterin-dependent oxidoreductase [Natrinema ejinorense]PCR90958.1 molybdopterin-binding oxidoreductase [Natrinema ejinorense]